MRKFYLGIDIGGTNTRIVLLRGLRRQKVRVLTFKTPRSRKGVEAEVRKRINDLTKGIKLSGIGVGVAGVVSQKRGQVMDAEHLRFLEGWNPVTFFNKEFHVPVKIENDARCFLYAESLWGNARGKKNVLGIAIGTGIGGAIMVDGKMYRGAHEIAGEFGDLVVDGDKTFENVSAKKAFERSGDRSAIIGRVLAGLISAFDPDLIVLGGGAVAIGKIKLPILRHEARRLAVSGGVNTPIVFGKLGDAAQAVGAALLFRKK